MDAMMTSKGDVWVSLVFVSPPHIIESLSNGL